MENEFKYTPGPWKVQSIGGRFISIATTQKINGDLICMPPHDAYQRSLKNWPANAKLIAAAPELLEALIFVRQELLDHLTAIEHPEIFIKMNAAISKATK